jgi:hypothetical protein
MNEAAASVESEVKAWPSEAEEVARRAMQARAFGLCADRRDPIPASILGALVKAQGMVERVGHDTTHSSGYRYTSSEAVIEASQVMAKCGLGMFPCGEVSRDGRLFITYIVFHENGDQWRMPETSVPIVAEGRALDKAEATAKTWSYGYTLRGLLKMPRFDDSSDANVRPDRAAPAVKPVPGRISDIASAADMEAWFAAYGHKLTELEEGARADAIFALVDKARDVGFSDLTARLDALFPKPAAEVA